LEIDNVGSACEYSSTKMNNVNDVLILYGSQRGKTEIAAKNFQKILSNRLATKDVCDCDRDNRRPSIATMELDDFLEDDSIPWSRVVVIFISSYGTGGVPTGAHKFRKVCNRWIAEYTDHLVKPKLLEGITFTLCGFGDSYYKTFMQNPNTTVEALTAAGATLIGKQGHIDASVEPLEKQQESLDDWIENTLEQLEQILIFDNDGKNEASTTTCTDDQLCRMKINMIMSIPT
jgi:sulfite reductase alpha subunit-like flavoprotein